MPELTEKTIYQDQTLDMRALCNEILALSVQRIAEAQREELSRGN